MTKKEKDKALELLGKNEIYNLSIIGYIKENPLKRLLINENSIMVQGNKEERWIYFYSNNENEFKNLITNINAEDKYFGALDNRQISILTENKKIDWEINAYQYHFPDEKTISENKIETFRLTKKESEYIISQSLYKEMLTVEYLNERIEKSVSAGIYENGKLIAWALTHDDGSLGSLHVLEEFRGKGYAKEITISLIRQCREIKKIPFIQCEKKNIPAQKLVEKIGFIRDRNVTWLKLK